MNEIEKSLKDNIEDYESVKRQALKFIYENKKELSKNYAYAEICGNPVDASHFFFLIDEKKPGSDLLLEMLDYALKNYVSSEKASVTACIKGGFHLVKKTGVDEWVERAASILKALPLPDFDRALVDERIERQLHNASEWRDIINTFFHRLSGIEDVHERKIYR